MLFLLRQFIKKEIVRGGDVTAYECLSDCPSIRLSIHKPESVGLLATAAPLGRTGKMAETVGSCTAYKTVPDVLHP